MNDIIQLKNPKTELYHHCKKMVVDMNFPWFYTKRTLLPEATPHYDRSNHTENSHLTHSLLVRPILSLLNSSISRFLIMEYSPLLQITG